MLIILNQLVALITGFGLIAFRDPKGIRPLVIGERDGKDRKEYIIASENASFSALGFNTLRDVEPGEAVLIDINGQLHSQQCADNPEPMPCLFEYVYLARPDSTLDQISVYKARMRMGKKLANKITKINPNHDIDVVIPIPDSSTTAALQVATELNIPYRDGFVKNRYIGRTFIMPYQEEREKSVRRKLNILDLEFYGKNVLLVDDSIVRGTTARPDATLDKISVYKARMRMGKKLANKIMRINPNHDIDVVIPIPDSSTTAALQVATELNIPYRDGFVKNRYIGRTFIMPYQEERKKSVRRKLNILDLEFKGKNVLLVDDSIVRGNNKSKNYRDGQGSWC